jgi:hypothetical protein
MNGTRARRSSILKIFERYMYVMIVNKEELEHFLEKFAKIIDFFVKRSVSGKNILWPDPT